MKRFYFFIVLACILVPSMLQAQANKRTIVISGTASYSKSESLPGELSQLLGMLGGSPYIDNFETTTYSILPRIGYFVTSNTAYGLGIGYQKTSSVMKDDTEKETIEFPRFVIEPYVRFYKPLTEHASFFIDGVVRIESGTDLQKYTDSQYPEDNEKFEIEVRQWGIMIRPGFTYKLTDHLALELTVGKLEYSSLKAKPKGASSSLENTTTAADFNLKKIQIGIEWYIFK